MRFLHIADVHLDTPFAGRSPALRRRLREACREAFGRAVDLALQKEVEAFLVAGDLFDSDLLSLQTEGFLLDQMRRLEEGGVAVIYATGNHDPGDVTSAASSLSWPSNVTVAAGHEPITVEIRNEAGVLVGRVTAAGHEHPRVTDDLAKTFPAPVGDVPEVALLHAQVRESPSSHEHDPYAPTTLATLQRSGYDYWALGHVHRRQALADSPPIHYSGNVQGRTPAETGRRGCLLVDLRDSSAPRVSFEPLAPVQWEHLRISGLEGARAHHHLLSEVTAAWNAVASECRTAPGTEFALVVELEGPSPLWARFREEEDLEALEDDLAARLGVLAVELRTGGLRPPVSPEAHRERQDVLGEALRLAAEVQRGEAQLPGLEPGLLGGFDPGEPGALGQYLSHLLEGAEGEILARLLRAPGDEGGRG